MSMDWVAIKGIMAAQIVLSTDCTQDEALAIIERHSIILLGVAEALAR